VWGNIGSIHKSIIPSVMRVNQEIDTVDRRPKDSYASIRNWKVPMERDYPRPRIVISRCIEFDPCRYDGSKIPSPTVALLKSFADCIPVCPEVEIGLGIPRATVRIVRMQGGDHLIQPATGRDVTSEMTGFSSRFLDSFTLFSRPVVDLLKNHG